MFKKVSSILVLFLLATDAMAQPCDVEHIKAQYHVTTESNGQTGEINDFILWRSGAQVAHQFEHQQITEIWFKQKNQRVNLTRAYAKYQQAIEYQSQELNSELDIDWHAKYTLISQPLLRSLRKVASEPQSSTPSLCDTLETYQGLYKGAQVQLKWLPQLQLVQSLTIATKAQTKHWQLMAKSHNRAVIDAQYRLWGDYKATDYADVGDNESDPFLRQMINLGHH